MLSASSWLSMALDLAQMVPDVQKNFEPNQFYMLSNFCVNKCAQKSTLGVSLLLAYS